jgi:hypothetical protein
MGLSFTVAAGPRQRSHSQVRVPWDSWPYFTVSDSRLPQSGGPGPRIYILQEQGGPVIPPGTGFALRCFLRLAGLRWRYSTPPPHGKLHTTTCKPRYTRIASGRNHRKHHFHCFLSNPCFVIEACIPRRCTETAVHIFFSCVFFAAGMCLPSCCLAMDGCCGSTIRI